MDISSALGKPNVVSMLKSDYQWDAGNFIFKLAHANNTKEVATALNSV